MRDEAIAIPGVSPDTFGWEWGVGRIYCFHFLRANTQRLKKTLILPFALALNL
jgi:hypothetical protein